MEQYLDMANNIVANGVIKSSGRAGMPDTKSIFGHTMRFNLQEGFPLMTTKKVELKNILVELIWFLKGDTNIKFLVDNGCNIWNKDAYRWYIQVCNGHLNGGEFVTPVLYDGEKSFIEAIKNGENVDMDRNNFEYKLGDLGSVYGKQWRNWRKGFPFSKLMSRNDFPTLLSGLSDGSLPSESQKVMAKLLEDYLIVDRLTHVDQIKEVINGIRKNPYGRRHIVSAWNPADLDDMALPPCHLLMHFNCRPATMPERDNWAWDNGLKEKYNEHGADDDQGWNKWHDENGVPNKMLDCLMYQRSVDTMLGLPYNIASYALLTEIIAKITHNIAGEFIWVGGDTHFYNNHFEAIKTQIKRKPKELPILKIADRVAHLDDPKDIVLEDFELIGYDPDPFIKAELFAGTG